MAQYRQIVKTIAICVYLVLMGLLLTACGDSNTTASKTLTASISALTFISSPTATALPPGCQITKIDHKDTNALRRLEEAEQCWRKQNINSYKVTISHRYFYQLTYYFDITVKNGKITDRQVSCQQNGQASYYKCDAEEFLAGSPLPIDIMFIAARSRLASYIDEPNKVELEIKLDARYHFPTDAYSARLDASDSDFSWFVLSFQTL